MRSISELQFEAVWKSASEETREEVIRYWVNNRLIPQTDSPERRVQEVIYVLRNSSHEVVGVSTASKLYLNFIGHHFYSFRCHIHPDFRGPAVDTQLLIKSKELLESKHKEGKEPLCVGLVVIVQNEEINKKWNYAVWPGVDLTFIGSDEKGNHIRICYFEGIKI
ncbi:MAG: hypothetical protein AAF363_16055 [Bacteroidota bacterium]